MADLKETLKKYISENNIKLKEQDDVKDEVEAARNALFNVSDERLLQSIRSLESVDQIGSFMIDLIDFANKMSPAPDLTKQLAHQYIDKGMIDVDAEEEDESASREVEFDIKPELADEEDIEEISTSGDAGAYMTKAAFKPKYGYELVKKKSKKDS